jgi:hypothetical protein
MDTYASIGYAREECWAICVVPEVIAVVSTIIDIMKGGSLGPVWVWALERRVGSGAEA